MEERGINPQGVALLAVTFAYLLAKPGVLQGWVDTYISAPLQRATSKPYSRDDFKIGKKMATGGFGTVYKAELTCPDTGEVETVVVKKAKEFGEAEVWMNERMMRAFPDSAARFITAFADGDAAKEGAPLWLAWTFEGNNTLAELMIAKDFPYNLEALLFERPLNIERGPDRRAIVLRFAMQQLLNGLKSCHSVGIVHRDVKPQNSIVSEAERRVKLIDWGAAADLRVGINYVPNQYLLDPRYAPPEQYVMPESTPKAPPAPVAAFLSPVLWRLNGPDRFDMYSVGIMLLQLALPPLRNDNNLIAFRRALRDQYNWNLDKWREATEKKAGKEWTEGFATLDALGGGGWDLAKQLVQYDPSSRLSAAAALAHPWFDPSPFESVASTVEGLGRAASSLADVDDGWLQKQIVRSGSEDVGGFTEIQLREELGVKTASNNRRDAPQTSATIAWWVDRQNDAEAKLRERREGNARTDSFLQSLVPRVTMPKMAAASKPAAVASSSKQSNNGAGGKKVKSAGEKPKGGLIGLVGLRKGNKK